MIYFSQISLVQNSKPKQGGDDLGFLDVQVSSAQEIATEQNQVNKMANIMSAFGSAPAQAPMVILQ